MWNHVDGRKVFKDYYSNMSEQSATTVPHCRRCGLHKARGTQVVTDEGIVIFRCDTCGRKMRMGQVEEAYLKAMEDRRGEERAVTNRDRYRRERLQKIDEDYTRAGRLQKPLPDAQKEFNDIMSPGYRPAVNADDIEFKETIYED